MTADDKSPGRGRGNGRASHKPSSRRRTSTTDTTATTATTATTTLPDPADLLREMMRIRRFEERCAELYSATKIRGFVHLCIGEVAVAVGQMSALAPGDAVVSTYRERGHALARGMSMESIMSKMFGKVTGCSRGRGRSMHLFDASHRFYGSNAIVAGGLPLAVGLALADHMNGRPIVTACIFGDGAMAEGEFHESANLAALWKLPVLFCCENNRYAMGTALAREHVQTDLATRAASYGMVAWTDTGWMRRQSRRPPVARSTRSEAAVGPASSSCAPTGSGLTRCTTQTATGRSPRSSSGSVQTRSLHSPSG